MPEWPYIVEETILPSYTDRLGIEPLHITAGDTVKWIRTLPNWGASQGWFIKYSMRGVIGSAIDFQSQAGGGPSQGGTTNGGPDDHVIYIPPAITTPWAPGKYQVQGKVQNGTDAFLVYQGIITVRPNLSIQPNEYDGRTHAKKCLDSIEAVLEGRATDDILNSTINGTVISRIPPLDLQKLWDHFKAMVRGEEAQAKAKNGRASGRRIMTRFTQPI